MFKQFFADHADLFIDAPQELGGEQNLEYYALYQKYLKLYEDILSEYITSLDVSPNEFYRELEAVQNDPNIKDKKLRHFVNYLIASTDYESFYKIMGRAAKKARKVEGIDGLSDKAESKSSAGESKSGEDSKGGDGKASDDRDSKYSHK